MTTTEEVSTVVGDGSSDVGSFVLVVEEVDGGGSESPSETSPLWEEMRREREWAGRVVGVWERGGEEREKVSSGKGDDERRVEEEGKNKRKVDSRRRTRTTRSG